MSLQHSCFTLGLVLIALVAGVPAAGAAETGTKTMPDSSIYPPAHSRVYYNHVRRHECALPSGHCGNNHRVTN